MGLGMYKRQPSLRRPSLLLSVVDGSNSNPLAAALAGGSGGGGKAFAANQGRRVLTGNTIACALALAAAVALLTTTNALHQLLSGSNTTTTAAASWWLMSGLRHHHHPRPAQHYPPSLYVQTPGSDKPATSWYVVSAFVDTRPLAFGEPGGVTLVAAGPREEVRKGKSWVASVVRLDYDRTSGGGGGGMGGHRLAPWHLRGRHGLGGGGGGGGVGVDDATTTGANDDNNNNNNNNAEVARIQCAPTHFVWFDTHPNNATHSGATIFCADEGAWATLSRRLPANVPLGVCLMSDAGSARGCAPRSVVPVSLPLDYPEYPTAWGAALLRDTLGGSTTTSDGGFGGGGFAASSFGGAAASAPHARAGLEASLKGQGDIAMCISPISSGIYTSTLRFFLQYYGQMGVDHVYMYMRRPSDPFRALVEGMVDEQRLMSRVLRDGDTPTLELVPWCLQQDATYGCVPGQHKLEPGFFNVAASNFGQILQIQDCFLRAMGHGFRWMLTVDLDEYIVPHVPHYIQNLHDMISANVLREPSGREVAPSEIRFQTAFFEPCLPGDDDRPLMSQQAQDAFFLREPESYPRPVWAAARVSEMFDPVTRSKFMCDTLTCDRVGIHFGFTTLCDRFKGRAAWPMACTSAPVYEISTDQVLIHHTRAQFAADAVVHKCSEHPKRNVTDWTFANFIFGERIRAQADARFGGGGSGGGGSAGDGGGGEGEGGGGGVVDRAPSVVKRRRLGQKQ